MYTLSFKINTCRQTSNIRSAEHQILNVSRLVLQLPLCNPLKPGVKSRMKMWLEQRRQALLQLHLRDQQFYCLLKCVFYESFYDNFVWRVTLRMHNQYFVVPCHTFTDILHGCLIGTGTIELLSQYQWSDINIYGKTYRYRTTRKHNIKAQNWCKSISWNKRKYLQVKSNIYFQPSNTYILIFVYPHSHNEK